MPKQQPEIETPKKKGKFLKYLLILLFSIIIAKYLVLWFLPASKMPETTETVSTPATTTMKTQPAPKEVTLNIDLAPLQETIGREYKMTQKDIHDYIKEQIERQRQSAYYNLTRDDGFLDWVFGWGTGYKMMYKKIKGAFGSDDNEVKMVSEKFQKDVISPNFSTMTSNIQNYAANRSEDFYKSAVIQTSKYLNEKIREFKKQGYSDIKVEPANVPWGRYISVGGSDGFALLELTGVTGVSAIAGKFIGAKIAAVIGPKMLALVGTKTAAVVGSKIAASFSIIFAPLVDYLVNEGTKVLMYDNTKKEFESVINDILYNTQRDITHQVDRSLTEIKNDVFAEINKQINIKAVK